MNPTYFTYITGVAALLGLLLQIFNFFPKYSQVRNAISLVVFGIFLGSFLGVLDAGSIKLDISFDGYTLIMSLFVIVIIGSLLIAVVTKEYGKRTELYTIAGVAFFVFLILFGVGSLFRSIDSGTDLIEREKKRLTISEMLYLADVNEERRDFDRTIMHLKSIRGRLSQEDPRREAIEKRIKSIKLKQVQ